jgi:hypothetical protein
VRRFPPQGVYWSRGNSKISKPIKTIELAEASGPIMKIPANPQRLPAGGEQA